MSGDERREAAALDRRILALLERAGADWRADPAELEPLLLEVFAHQVRWNPAYARYAAARGATPARVRRSETIPPVPARAFAHLRMATFPPDACLRRFRSSGTSGGPRSLLELDTLALYEAALLPAFTRHLLPDRAALAWVALVPDPGETPDSSLAAMIGAAAKRLGAAPEYFLQGARLDLVRALAHLRQLAAARQPVLLLGTAIALLEATGALAERGERVPLPAGSRVMETGGFKSNRRAVERHVLYAAVAERFDIPVRAIVGEYGMTEMASQFYDTTLREAIAGDPVPAGLDDPRAPRLKAAPPWVKTRVVDPATLEEVADGDEGILVHVDVAARSSAVALLTEDLGRRSGTGFELLGRVRGATARGCSLALDQMTAHGEIRLHGVDD